MRTESGRVVEKIAGVWKLLIAGGKAWSDDRAMRLGASIAYYSLFALVPVLVLVISIASFFFPQQAVAEEIHDSISEFLDEDVADLVVSGITRAKADQSSYLPLFGVGVLLFSATLLFAAWREVVDIIWGLPKEHGLRAAVRNRVLGAVAILGAGILLVLAMLIEAVFGALAGWSQIDLIGPVWTIVGTLGSTLVGMAFLAVLLKYSPGTDISWRSVVLPSVVTMLLLSIGARAYGIYMNSVGLTSAAGIAGSAFLGLVVVYYAAAILLYGVELVKLGHLESATARRPGEGTQTGIGRPSPQPTEG